MKHVFLCTNLFGSFYLLRTFPSYKGKTSVCFILLTFFSSILFFFSSDHLKIPHRNHQIQQIFKYILNMLSNIYYLINLYRKCSSLFCLMSPLPCVCESTPVLMSLILLFLPKSRQTQSLIIAPFHLTYPEWFKSVFSLFPVVHRTPPAECTLPKADLLPLKFVQLSRLPM